VRLTKASLSVDSPRRVRSSGEADSDVICSDASLHINIANLVNIVMLTVTCFVSDATPHFPQHKCKH
jgi:hypothetical protein